jgi:hypothetical protein
VCIILYRAEWVWEDLPAAVPGGQAEDRLRLHLRFRLQARLEVQYSGALAINQYRYQLYFWGQRLYYIYNI